jgi:hypothetical protein
MVRKSRIGNSWGRAIAGGAAAIFLILGLSPPRCDSRGQKYNSRQI